MVEAAHDWPGRDHTLQVNGAMDGRILAQGKVWPVIVVITGVGLEDPAQVVLAQDDDVVQALPSDRSDQSLDMAVLPW